MSIALVSLQQISLNKMPSPSGMSIFHFSAHISFFGGGGGGGGAGLFVRMILRFCLVLCVFVFWGGGGWFCF